MADDYAKATASPRPFTIGGREYLVGKFNPRDLGDLQAWLKAQSPDPRTKAREMCQGLSDAVALEVWRELSAEALDWPPSIDSPDGNRLLMLTLEGNAMVLWVSLRRHNRSVDLAEARRIAEDVTTDEVNELVRLGFPEATFDPKATSGTTTTPTETADRGPVPK